MTKEKFTKGEWGIDKKYSTFFAVSSGVNVVCGVTCLMDDYNISPSDEEKANAHLIAAAPEMYDFIKEHCAGLPEAEFLLAKARGEYE